MLNPSGRNLHLGKGIGIKEWGVLCLGIHGTWRAGGAGAGVGAAGFVSRRKEPVGFLERLTRKEVALRKVFKDLLGAGRYAPWF